MPCPNPLTPDQCQVLTNVIQYLHDSKLLIQKCEACGITMPDKLTNNQMQMELATAIKREFFPGEN